MNRERMGRGGRGGGGRYNGGGRGRGGRRQNGRYPRQSAESGNQRERVAVESGQIVFIDQFMLANPQFIDAVEKLIDADAASKNAVVQEFGGIVVEIEPGTYRIERDPFAFSIVVHPDGVHPEMSELSGLATSAHGHVFIDTRCLAMIDRELLDDAELLRKYQHLWFSGQDKACRDLLRDNGGAVRYGFQRLGDELGIYTIPGQSVVCLWPDVAEEIASPVAAADASSLPS